jgi:hypothetical protein
MILHLLFYCIEAARLHAFTHVTDEALSFDTVDAPQPTHLIFSRGVGHAQRLRLIERLNIIQPGRIPGGFHSNKLDLFLSHEVVIYAMVLLLSKLNFRGSRLVRGPTIRRDNMSILTGN